MNKYSREELTYIWKMIEGCEGYMSSEYLANECNEKFHNGKKVRTGNFIAYALNRGSDLGIY